IYEDLILQHTVIIEMSDSYLRNEWAKSSSDTSLVPLNNQQNYAVDETMNMNPNLQHIYMSQISAIQPQFGGRNQVWTSPDDVPPKEQACTSTTKHCILGSVIGLLVAVATLVPILVWSLTKSSNDQSSPSASNSAVTAGGSYPSQCTGYYVLADSTRNIGSPTGSGSYGDVSCYNFYTNWYRIMGNAGTMLTTNPTVSYQCASMYPGYYQGTHPATAGQTTTGTVCFMSSSCLYTTTISVTLCNGYYVYNLPSVSGSCIQARYCTV
ncbi:unnamed protein product, partial [Didymodactylos carnosus]